MTKAPDKNCGALVGIPERPLVFHGPEIRGLLAGRKRSDRRIIKLPPASNLGTWEASTIGGPGCHDADGNPTPQEPVIWHSRTGTTIACPFGRVGDRLWSRETWCQAGWDAVGEQDPQADDGRPRGPLDPVRELRPFAFYRATDNHVVDADNEERSPWRSAMHQPRWASRLLLEITSIRVQRLKSMDTDDAIAEGAFYTDYGRTDHGGLPEHQDLRPGWSMAETTSSDQCLSSPIAAYGNRWNQIHAGPRWNEMGGPCPWDLDPWVWALGLRVVEPAP